MVCAWVRRGAVEREADWRASAPSMPPPLPSVTPLSVQDVVCRPVSPARHVEDTHAYARRTCGQVVACTTAVGEEVRLPPRLSHFSTVSIDSHGWQAAATFLTATVVLDTSKAPL